MAETCAHCEGEVQGDLLSRRICRLCGKPICESCHLGINCPACPLLEPPLLPEVSDDG